jgi:hypothetical protein
MTTRTFRPSDSDQLLLLPPARRDWLPEDHLAYFVTDLVDELEVKAIHKAYGGVTLGTGPYDPRMPVRVRLYAYAMDIARLLAGCKRTWPFEYWLRPSGRISERSATSASSIWQHWPTCSCRSCGCVSGLSW